MCLSGQRELSVLSFTFSASSKYKPGNKRTIVLLNSITPLPPLPPLVLPFFCALFHPFRNEWILTRAWKRLLFCKCCLGSVCFQLLTDSVPLSEVNEAPHPAPPFALVLSSSLVLPPSISLQLCPRALFTPSFVAVLSDVSAGGWKELSGTSLSLCRCEIWDKVLRFWMKWSSLIYYRKTKWFIYFYGLSLIIMRWNNQKVII